MKRLPVLFILAVTLFPQAAPASDRTIYLNAFGETATAYLNDSFLLLGTTADSFAADKLPKATALEIVQNVQKRAQLIRTKLRAVLATRIAEVDQKLIGLLDNAFECMDQESLALIQYVEDKSPESARLFESRRTKCLESIQKIVRFHSILPPSS